MKRCTAFRSPIPATSRRKSKKFSFLKKIVVSPLTKGKTRAIIAKAFDKGRTK